MGVLYYLLKVFVVALITSNLQVGSSCRGSAFFDYSVKPFSLADGNVN